MVHTYTITHPKQHRFHINTHLISTLGIKSANDCGFAAAPVFDGLASSSSSSSSSSPAAAATPLVGAGGDSPAVYITLINAYQT